MKKSGVIVLTLAAALMLGLSACGEDNTKTEEGMQEISALQYNNALALFDEAENLGENERLIERGRGIAYLSLLEYDKARDCFLNSLSMSDGFVEDIDYDLNYYLAESYIGLEEYENAESVYTSIIAMDEQADAYYLRGGVRLALGMYTLAAEDFDKAISLAPKDIDRLIKIYLALAGNGYESAGADYLRAALEDYSGTMTNLDKGRIYYYLGDYQSAAVALEAARTADENSRNANLFLGKAYEAVGEYNYASNVYQSYLARNSEDALIYNQLGLCYMELKDYEDALEAFENGLAVNDRELNMSLLYNEIVAYEYIGDFDTADTLMTNYLTLYPNDTDAKREQLFLTSR